MDGSATGPDDNPQHKEKTDDRPKEAEAHVPTAGKYRDPLVILDEMLECIRLIHSYTDGTSFETFAAQQVLQDAVVLRIAILGEAASHLRDEDKANWSTVPWRIITDMRNRLIHGYFAIRKDLVWQVVVADLPTLEAQLKAIRDTLG